jgi:hypothetical protein
MFPVFECLDIRSPLDIVHGEFKSLEYVLDKFVGASSHDPDAEL